MFFVLNFLVCLLDTLKAISIWTGNILLTPVNEDDILIDNFIIPKNIKLLGFKFTVYANDENPVFLSYLNINFKGIININATSVYIHLKKENNKLIFKSASNKKIHLMEIFGFPIS